MGLSHSLSRYKLKFSPDKVDTMIVQAIGLLDDLDKELNTYAMRVREWYGWHFPELAKIIQDNIQYAKSVKFMGTRDKAAALDFSGILEEEVETRLKESSQISMGTEISQEDLLSINDLATQVIELSEYRAQLYDYLKSRMTAIAPNLTVLVGELVGARLIAHAGSLVNLAKHPASTVQILGAEKALFRALKTKHETPKYGLIYHASLIGQSSQKFKGKISRVLAAKCALAIRVDALGDSADATIGIESRAKVEARMRQLEGKVLATDGAKAKGGKVEAQKYDKSKQAGAISTQPKAYNADADVAVPDAEKKVRVVCWWKQIFQAFLDNPVYRRRRRERLRRRRRRKLPRRRRKLSQSLRRKRRSPRRRRRQLQRRRRRKLPRRRRTRRRRRRRWLRRKRNRKRRRIRRKRQMTMTNRL